MQEPKNHFSAALKRMRGFQLQLSTANLFNVEQKGWLNGQEEALAGGSVPRGTRNPRTDLLKFSAGELQRMRRRRDTDRNSALISNVKICSTWNIFGLAGGIESGKRLCLKRSRIPQPAVLDCWSLEL